MLCAEHFAEFFQALHGRPPFAWQTRLAKRVLAQGSWPDVLDLPTGAGKTSTLDIALFAVAVDPLQFPRRIVQVVDRRIVVDQGAEHARHILGAMHAGSGILAEVADALRRCWGGRQDEPPFTVAVMRGAMPRDDAWARRPDQPVVALSTVDQAGSRLLFRGFGVSGRMAPIHAGLLGNDTLFLLDEVHLAVPFSETLVAIRDRWRASAVQRLPDRWGVVRMSATPSTAMPTDVVFGLEAEDRDNVSLSRRLEANKLARLVPVPGSGRRAGAKLARECVREALEHIDAGSIAVAVVVNRVDTAREAHRLLCEGRRQVDTVLLTGRMRPLDRDAILDERLRTRIGSGRDRGAEPRPIVLVATQCVEVGADFDFDALVTECASLDAIRQRFGRLDRLGELGCSRASILVREDQAEQSADDPVYGIALSNTWSWLQELGEEVNLGIDHLPIPGEGDLEDLLAPVEHAPVLLPAHLDAWAQTRPRPLPEPDVSLWLHGPERGRPDVQVVWRADLSHDLLVEASERGAVLEDVRRQLVACPPGSLEAVSVPLHAARAWLSGDSAPEIADVVGATMPEAGAETGRPVLRWRGDESQVVDPAGIVPGDTLVVPSTYGGLRHGNWDPDADQASVRDLGDLVQWHQRGRATLRLQPDVLSDWVPAELALGAPVVPPADAPER